MGNGSDEMIDLLFRIFCVPGRDKVLIVEPTYGAYSVFAAINDIEVSTCHLQGDYSLDLRSLETIFKLMQNSTPEEGMHKLLFLCSPNNPTGNSFPLSEVVAIANKFPGITVVDEAYVEFSTKPSAVTLLEKCPRLVVLRTLSKGWALANARVGLALAPPAIVEAMHHVKYPYNLSGVAQDIAMEVLSQKEAMEENVATVKRRGVGWRRSWQLLSLSKKCSPAMLTFCWYGLTTPMQSITTCASGE